MENSGNKTQIIDDKTDLHGLDLESLINDLQLHQIELRIQNEDLKSVQVELEESRNRYSDLYDFAPVSYFVFDKKGIIRQLNLTASKKLNAERSYLIGLPFFLFVSTEYRNIFYNHIKKVIYSRQKQTCELKIIPKKLGINPDINIMEVQLESDLQNNLSSNSAKEIMIRAVMTDVTDLKRIEKELLEKEHELEIKKQVEEIKNFYENIVETIQEGLWKIDLSGKTLYVNNQMAELLGYSSQEMIGRKFFDFIDEDHIELAHTMLDRRKHGMREKYESRFIKRDGSKIWVTISASPIIDADSKQINSTIGLITDITEQKNTEIRLKDSEEKYRTIVEYSNDLIWAEDTEGKITFCNRKTERMSGYNSSELLGKNLLDFVVKEDIGRLKSIFDVVLHGQPIEYETKFINKFYKQIIIAVNKAPIYSKGKVIGCTSFGRDITEQKLAEEKLKKFSDKLKKSNEDLEQFAYIASHDLQEPLRTVSSYTELISKRYKGRLDPEADEFIDYIIKGTRRMQNMIFDLLQLSRVSSRGKSFKPTDINEVLSLALKNLNELIDRNRASILIDKMPIVNGDFGQLVQLFQNLIDNAIKFRKPDETPQILINAVYQSEKPQWLFSVQDNGIGIDPNDFKKLFIIFHRLHNREEYPGTGIGLSICKKIVERHCGKIWISSEPGKGSTFYFTIPIEAGDLCE